MRTSTMADPSQTGNAPIWTPFGDTGKEAVKKARAEAARKRFQQMKDMSSSPLALPASERAIQSRRSGQNLAGPSSAHGGRGALVPMYRKPDEKRSTGVLTTRVPVSRQYDILTRRASVVPSVMA